MTSRLGRCRISPGRIRPSGSMRASRSRCRRCARRRSRARTISAARSRKRPSEWRRNRCQARGASPSFACSRKVARKPRSTGVFILRSPPPTFALDRDSDVGYSVGCGGQFCADLSSPAIYKEPRAAMGKLTALDVARATEGMYGDGGGLWLQVKRGRSWIFRYTFGGKARSLGLGSAAVVPLKRARELALEHRRLIAEGTDPLAHKRARRAAAMADAAGLVTFKE